MTDKLNIYNRVMLSASVLSGSLVAGCSVASVVEEKRTKSGTEDKIVLN